MPASLKQLLKKTKQAISVRRKYIIQCSRHSAQTGICWTQGPKLKLYYEFWFRTVKEFSARNLTFKIDKLIALSAVARSISLGIGSLDEYPVRMWKRDLYVYLLWKPERALQRYDSRSDLSGSRPSWSWVSVDGKIDVPEWWAHYHDDGKGMINRCPVQLDPRIQYHSHGDRFGDSTAAELDATGVIFKVDLRVHRPRHDNHSLEEQCDVTIPRTGWHRAIQLFMN
jgi:hypothetical protein